MKLDTVIRLFSCVSFVIGAVECFAGFKIMKTMLVIWGLFIGALLGAAVGVTAGNVVLGVILVLLFSVGLAILAYKLYLAGIFILIVFSTALAFYVILEKIVLSLLLGIAIGALAMFFVKPVVIMSTAFSGTGIILSSAYKIMNLGINANPVVTAILWIPIALAGIVVQYLTTQKPKPGRSGARPSRRPDTPATSGERKYSGMQMAYRNFCIRCGNKLNGTAKRCPRCGFSFED